MNIKSDLYEMNLENRTVFLRADLNVPLLDDKITSDFRLQSLQPTLDLLIEKKAKIILATHIGRPEAPDPHLSTKLLLPWFEAHSYTIKYAADVGEAQSLLPTLLPQTILLLENLRFFPGEKSHDEQERQSFANQLYSLADYYVNDAFGLLHRQDTSITLLPSLYTPENRTVGLLIEKEIRQLSCYFENPKKPFMLIIGGGKVKDKLPFIQTLVEKNKIDAIILLPALVFTFLKAQQKNIGNSLVADELIPMAQQILDQAAQKSIPMILPLDYLIALDSLEGPLSIVDAKDMPAGGIGIAVGPKTIELYKEVLKKIGTVYLNGAMGLTERPETIEPLKRLLQAVAQLNCCIIGGGESVAAVYQCNLEKQISYCSTGGGASLYFLTYGTLPALF